MSYKVSDDLKKFEENAKKNGYYTYFKENEKNNFDKICIRDCDGRRTKWRLEKKIEKNHSVFVRNGSKNVECKYTKSDVGYATLAK